MNVRLPPEQLAPLDAWIAAQPDPQPSRPEAVREAVADWLDLQENRSEGTNARPSARGFFIAADGYRTAAAEIYPLIHGKTDQVPSVFLAFYNILGLSLELYLKSYLSISAFRSEQMQRKFGHKLIKLYNKTDSLGLEADFNRLGVPQANLTSRLLREIVSVLAPQYLDNSLRYMSDERNDYKYIENINDVFTVMERLHFVVQQKLLENSL